jgi:hypothetical protein
MPKPIFKSCENGDGRIAIGTGIRPIKFCRPCHLAAYGDQFTAWNVIIPHRELGLDPEDMAIACAKTGEDISAGTVWLDPVETRIDALVYGGLIEAIPVKAAPVEAGKTEA